MLSKTILSKTLLLSFCLVSIGCEKPAADKAANAKGNVGRSGPEALQTSQDYLPLDLNKLTSSPDEFHNRMVATEGIVTSVCKQEGCFIDIVPLSGSGHGVLVNSRNNVFQFPKDSVGKIATVKGTFCRKIYPFSRMDHWHHHGWRAAESSIPAFSALYRIEADEFLLREQERPVKIEEHPLSPISTTAIDLNRMEFEAARMSAGKACLAPGEDAPEHSSGRYHEIVFAIEGEVRAKMENEAEEIRLPANHICYIPPNTKHRVSNKTTGTACYIFVTSLPEPSQADDSHQAAHSTAAPAVNE